MTVFESIGDLRGRMRERGIKGMDLYGMMGKVCY